MVLTALHDNVAQLAIGTRTFSVGMEELSQFWFGDHLLLWRPGAWAKQILVPGIQDDSVLWLRESLALIGNTPLADPESEFYDDALADLVRNYQRERRLTVDGIVGTQTQILMNSDLAIGDTPLLFGRP